MGVVDGVTTALGSGDFIVVVATNAFTVVVEVVATDFVVVVGCSVVVDSLSLNLKKPVIPLKNPFFLVVDSGISVVVVVVVRTMGGKGLKSDSA